MTHLNTIYVKHIFGHKVKVRRKFSPINSRLSDTPPVQAWSPRPTLGPPGVSVSIPNLLCFHLLFLTRVFPLPTQLEITTRLLRRENLLDGRQILNENGARSEESIRPGHVTSPEIQLAGGAVFKNIRVRGNKFQYQISQQRCHVEVKYSGILF